MEKLATSLHGDMEVLLPMSLNSDKSQNHPCYFVAAVFDIQNVDLCLQVSVSMCPRFQGPHFTVGS